MKALVKSSLVVGGACAVALSGSFYAFAGWDTAAPPAQVVIKTAAMPQGNAPSVEKTGRNATLRWVPNRIVPGVKVQSYIVTRRGPGDPVVVCDQVTTASCRDKLVPAGTWTWTVRPVLETWQGEDSEASLPLQFGGAPQPASAARDTAPATRGTGTAPGPAGEPGTAEPSAGEAPDPAATATPPRAAEPTTAPPTSAPTTPAEELPGTSAGTAEP